MTPTGYDWYYGLNGQTPVNTITPNPFEGVLAWICPICGESTQNYVTCWNCGYHYGDPVYLPAHPTSASFTWTCPVCGGSNQDVMDCWSCGYHYGNPVGYNGLEHLPRGAHGRRPDRLLVLRPVLQQRL